MLPRIILLLAIVGLASACGSRAPATGTSPTRISDDAADPPRTSPVPAPVLDSFAPTGPAFILSTNEPFWNARVDGDVLVLKGLDGERRLTITVNQALPDGRHVMAQDDAGRVEIRIAPMLCQDSMSGADFPYTGRLTFDEAVPIPGCARPASDPPPGEPAAKRP